MTVVHEMGITLEVLDSAVRAAEQAGASRITVVRLTVGELTEVVPDALQFAWEAITPGTLAEGATLEVLHVGARSKCGDCGLEFAHDRYDRSCPECGGFLTSVLAGRDLSVDTIEIDAPDDECPAPGPAPAGIGA